MRASCLTTGLTRPADPEGPVYGPALPPAAAGPPAGFEAAVRYDGSRPGKVLCVWVWVGVCVCSSAVLLWFNCCPFIFSWSSAARYDGSRPGKVLYVCVGGCACVCDSRRPGSRPRRGTTAAGRARCGAAVCVCVRARVRALVWLRACVRACACV